MFGNEIPDQVGDDVIAGLTGNLLLIQRSSNVNSTCNCPYIIIICFSANL